MADKQDQVELLLKMKEDFSSKLAKIEAQGDKTFKSLTEQSKKSKSSIGSVSKAVGSLVASLGLIAAAKKSFSMVTDINANRDSILNFANATGVAVKDLSELQYVAELNKTSFESVQGAIKKMAMTLGQAELGSTNSKKAFEGLGISIKDTDGELKGVNELFEESVDALSQVENETERLTKAQLIFGRGATELGSIISGGADALREAKEEADELGVSFDRLEAEQAAKFNDEMLRMESRMKGFTQTLVTLVTPALSDFLENWNMILKGQNGDFVKGQSDFGVKWAQASADLKLTLGIQEKLNEAIANGASIESGFGAGMTISQMASQLEMQEDLEEKERDIIKSLKEEAKLHGYITNEIRNRSSEKKNIPKGFGGEKTSKKSSSKDPYLESLELDLAIANAMKSDNQEVQLGSLEDWEKEQTELSKAKAIERNEMLAELNRQSTMSDLEQLKVEKEKELEFLNQFGLEKFETEKYYNDLIAEENAEIARKEREIQIARMDTALDTASALIQASQSAIAENKKAGNALKIMALAEIAINTSRGIMNAWASGNYIENIIETAGILGIAGIQTGVVASQSFANGGVVQPESGVNSYSGDNIKVNVNAGEEILTANDPRHVNNNGGMSGGQSIIIQGDVYGYEDFNDKVNAANEYNKKNNVALGVGV